MILTKQQVAAVGDRPPVTVDVPAPELGEGAVLRLKRLRVPEYKAFTEAATDRTGDRAITRADGLFSERLIQACAVDAEGQPVIEDLAVIARWDASLYVRVANAALKLNGLNETDEDAAKN